MKRSYRISMYLLVIPAACILMYIGNVLGDWVVGTTHQYVALLLSYALILTSLIAAMFGWVYGLQGVGFSFMRPFDGTKEEAMLFALASIEGACCLFGFFAHPFTRPVGLVHWCLLIVSTIPLLLLIAQLAMARVTRSPKKV